MSEHIEGWRLAAACAEVPDPDPDMVKREPRLTTPLLKLRGQRLAASLSRV